MAGARITFDLEEQEAPKSALEEEREKHKTRAERFGTDYRDPAATKPQFAQLARRERFKREGFATGIDLFSPEEVAKRAARAKKFGIAAAAAADGEGYEGDADGAAAGVPQDLLAYRLDPEDAKRRARALKFGVQYEAPSADTLLQKADLFEPRKDAPQDVPRREEAVYLYGVDLLSTADCLAYFDNYAPTLVEWINDSSCCVVFADGATARRAIAGSGHPLAPEELASAPDGMDQHMSDAGALNPSEHMHVLWHKGRPFLKSDGRKEAKVPLLYRMATVLDEKDPHADKRSRYLWKPQGKRPRQQQQQQQHDGDGDVEMKRQRGARGGRGRRRHDGDEAMHDAEYDEAAGEAAAHGGEHDLREAAQEPQHGGAPAADREALKLADIARRQADEELAYEEVVADEDGDGM